MSTPARILVVEDEPPVLRGLLAALSAAGYEAEGAATAAAAVDAAALRPPDAVILDLLLPDGTGTEVARRLREWTQIPIVIVSAVDQEREKIAALDAGADDYVTKPYSVGELLARVRAALRRGAAPPGEEPVVAFGDVRVDLALREVRRGGELVHLTPHEYGLLAELCRHPGRVLTHRTLLLGVWGEGYAHETHYLRVYMGNLRRKLEEDPSRPVHLVTETGVGYRLRTGPPETLTTS